MFRPASCSRGTARACNWAGPVGSSRRSLGTMPAKRYWNYRCGEDTNMANVLKAIVGRLNDTMRTTLEGAAGLCLARTHYDVEIEHVLTKLLEAGGKDFAGIIQHFDVDKTRLSGELARSLDKLKSGNARTPAFSPSLLRMLREAWTVGSLEFGAGQVRSGTVILAVVADDAPSRLVLDVSKERRKIGPEALRRALPAIIADSRDYTS